MLYYVKLYFTCLVAFLAVDMVWLGLIAKNFYRKYIGFLLAPNPNWVAAIIFYLLFVVGVVVFVVVPGIKETSIKNTLLRAALFGLITYATYDLTNMATVKDWPLIVTVIDLIWGMVLSTIVGVVGYYAAQWLH